MDVSLSPHSATALPDPFWEQVIFQNPEIVVLLGRRLTAADAQDPKKLHTKKKTGIFLKRRKRK